MALRRDEYLRRGFEAIRRTPPPEPVMAPAAPPDLTQEDVAEARRQRALRRTSETEKALDLGIAGVKAGGYAARGLARNLFGGEGDADLERAVGIQQQAAEDGPRIQQVEDIEGVGDALAYGRNMVAQQVPNLVTMLGTGGLVGAAGAGLRRAGLKAATNRVAAEMAERAGQQTVSRALQKRAGEVVQRAVRGQAPSQTASRVGAAAGGSVLQSGQMAEAALDETQGGTTQERAAKAAVGAIATGAFEALPVAALLKKYGLGAAEDAARGAFTGGVATRVAKAAGAQAATESATEVAQTFGELATHKWINSNVDLLDDDALSAYLNAAVGGAVGGAAFGAPAGLRSADRESPRIKEGLRQGWDSLQAKLRPTAPSDAPAGSVVAEPEGPTLGERARDATKAATARVSDAYQSTLASLKDTMRFDSMTAHAITGKPFDSQIIDGEQVIGGAPFAQFVDKPRMLQYRTNLGLPRTEAMFASSLEDEGTVSRLAETGALTAARKAFTGWDVGKFDETERAGLNSYLEALPAPTRAKFESVLSWLERESTVGRLEHDETGAPTHAAVYTPESAGRLATSSESQDGEQRAAERAEREGLGIFESTSETRLNVFRAGRGTPVRSGMPKDALIMEREDGSGDRRRVNLYGAIQELRQDPAFVATIREMPAEQRTEAQITTALGYLAEQGYRVDPESIRSGIKLADGWVITKPMAMRLRAGMGDQQAIDLMAQRGRQQPLPARGSALDDARGQADRMEMIDQAPPVPGEQPFIERAPFLPGQGSPSTAAPGDTRTLDSGTVDYETLRAEQQAERAAPRANPQAGVPVSERRRRIASRRNRENVREDAARRNTQRTNAGANERQQAIQDEAARGGSTERVREASQRQRDLGRAVGEAIAAVPAAPRAAAPKAPTAPVGPRMAARMREQSSNRHVDKDAGKARRATAFIGDGAVGSSTKLYRTIAQQLGMLKDRFTADDRVFVSINGARAGAVPLRQNGELTAGYKALEAATEAGATIVTDNQANRERSYNQGERDIAAYLQSRGYVESGKNGEWKPAPRLAPLALTNASAAQTLREYMRQGWKELKGAAAEGKAASEQRRPLGFEAAIAKLMASKEGVERLVAELPRLRSRAGFFALEHALRLHRGSPHFERVNVAMHKRAGSLAEAISRAGMRQGQRRDADDYVEGAAYQRETGAIWAAVVPNPLATTPAPQFLRSLMSAFDKGQQAILQGFLDSGALDKVRVTVGRSFMAEHVAGYYLSQDHSVTITLPDVDDLGDGGTLSPLQTIVHEMTHAATMSAEMTNASARKDLNALLQHVRRYIQDNLPDVDVDEWYGLSETQEFLAEAFSNPHFQTLLEQVPALNTETFQSAWAQFKDWVKTLLGLNNAQVTALEEALTIGRVMAEQNANAYILAKGTFFGSATMYGSAATAANSSRARTPADFLPFLSETDRATLLAALDTEDVKAQIRPYLKPAMRHWLEAGDTGPRIMLDLGVALALDGKLSFTHKRDRSALGRLWDVISKALRIPSANVYAQQMIKDARAGKIGPGYQADARTIVRNPGDVVGKASLAITRAVNKHVVPVTDALLKNMNTRMRETGVPAMRELATIMAQRTGEFRADKEKSYRHHWEQQRGRYLNKLAGIVAGMSEENNAKLATALQSRVRPRGELGKLYDSVRGYLDEMYDYMTEAGIPLGKREDYFPTIMDTAAVAANREDFFALHREFEPQIRERFERWTDDKIKAMGKPDPKDKAANKELRRLHNIRDGIRKRDLDELIGELFDMALYGGQAHYIAGVDFTHPSHKPAFKHSEHMVSDFIYETGTPEQRKRFAAFQSKDVAGVLAGYTNRATRRAEWERLDITDRVAGLMERAPSEGATPKQMAMMRDYVNMEMGTYNDNWHPMVKRVLVGVDRMFDTKLAETDFQKAKNVMGAFQTYNNLRLLPLAILSSLVDPLATMVRSGGISGAHKNLLDGLRAMRTSGGRDELRKMAETMGLIEREGLSDIMATLYGNVYDPDGKAAKVNSWLFKYNGLETMMRYTRLTALAAGHRFLIRHKTQPNEHSERYLRELGLTPGMIRVRANGQFVVLSPEIESALRRFVEESTVRPSPGQKPGWHNDPNFALASQYKGYLYAFYETVIKRFWTEFGNGNPGVITPVLLYLPLTMMAEMTRDVLQGDGEDKEPEDYLGKSVERSGLLGPRVGVTDEATRNVTFGSGITGNLGGPTGQQLGDAYDVVTGGASFGGFFEEALPGQALFKNWGSSDDQQVPAG